MLPSECQNIEWKESWRDDYLCEICAFANAQGGRLHIGRNDSGVVTGLPTKQCRKLSEDIPNKVRETMGLFVEVNLLEEDGREYLEIVVPEVSYPVNYHGKYLYRSGSTTQCLTGAFLTHFLHRKTGRLWDDMPVERVTPDDLDEESFESFRRRALQSRRMNEEDVALSRSELLEKLNLVDEDKRLKRAAVLLFHRRPERWFPGAWVKVGFFANNADILYQDEVHGSLLMQAERVIDLLYTKYMVAPISYEGMIRVERYPFPREAVREALYNALIHSDYVSNVPIQISVYKDRLYIFNKAALPPELTEEKLWGKHGSHPLNPALASTFFRAGYVESWGRGIEKMCRECEKIDAPEPTYDLSGGGVMICFRAAKVRASETSALALTDRQVALLSYLRIHPDATYEQTGLELNVSRKTVCREIAKMREAGILVRKGSIKNGEWMVKSAVEWCK